MTGESGVGNWEVGVEGVVFMDKKCEIKNEQEEEGGGMPRRNKIDA